LENVAKQRFIDLDVEEISLVDKPANEIEILVMKRNKANETEEDIMKNEKTDVVETEKNNEEATTEAVEISTNNESVTKALDNVASIVKNVTKAVYGKTDDKVVDNKETTDNENSVAEVAATKNETDEKNVTNDMNEKLERFEEKFDFITKRLEDIEKIIVDNNNNEVKEVEKSITIDELNKSFKDFTTIIQKSINGQEELTERIESIESSRIPSQSIENETVVRKSENIWEGIIY
jgi:uncharacterized coiled-coil protein SlyX